MAPPAAITPVAPGTPISGLKASGPDTNLTASAIDHKTTSQPAGYQELDASKLVYKLTSNPRPIPEYDTAAAGSETICTDHMVKAMWNAATGWSAPVIEAYGPISLMPTASVLHYATECFEGLKAYRGFDGKLRLFRPDRNANRMLMSSVRIAPSFPPEALERLLIALMAVDGPKWLPRQRPGTLLYLRPTMIGTQPQLGVQAPSQAMLFITASYFPVMDSPTGGMRLHTSPEDMVRAWVGGFGYAKVGANYGPSLLATKEARDRGYHQILWLYGPEAYCTEAGASNFFVLWKNKDSGRLELVTAPLDDRVILGGITRMSVVELARSRLTKDLDVVERRYTIDEVFQAQAEGRLVESFASGTAYFVCPISLIHHRGRDAPIPMGEDGQGGQYTKQLKQWLKDIMYGNEQHEWGVVVPEEQ